MRQRVDGDGRILACLFNMDTGSYRGFRICADYTESVDQRIFSLFSGIIKPEGWALVAVGGYGRQDMCMHSDVDILLLAKNRRIKNDADCLISSVIYPLWDIGMNASYSIRTPDETVRDANRDFFLKTSLLTTRFIAGGMGLYEDLCIKLKKASGSGKWIKAFISGLAHHDIKRHDLLGDDSYILEPDIKDGSGGLRDFHSIVWLARTISGGENLGWLKENHMVSSRDMKDLCASVDFLMMVRFALHKAAGRKQDILNYEYQERLAPLFTSTSPDMETPVESFMKRFHQAASTIKTLHKNITLSSMEMYGLIKTKPLMNIDSELFVRSGMISFAAKPTTPLEPTVLMKAFLASANTGLELSPAAKSSIRDDPGLAVKIRSLKDARLIFLEMLTSDHPETVLAQMLETGVLEVLIPEFSRIRSKVQYDVYHIHTVDMHSIHTVRELKDLEQKEKPVFSMIHDRTVLMLAALLHDIGKGSGGRHAATGAALAHDIALRLGLGPARSEDVSFLVRNHLLLPNTATRRDLSEEKTVFMFARSAGSAERLCMLYLLSMADSIATGPAAFNDWKKALFRELFVKALHFLQKGELRTLTAIHRLDTGWDELIRAVPRQYSSRLWALPQHYLLHHETADILKHLKLSGEVLKGSRIRIDIVSTGRYTRLTVITMDRPGLFAELCCIMACMNLEVFSAKVFTWHNGVAVDVFDILPPWEGYDGWETFYGLFDSLSSGRVCTETILSERACLVSASRRPLVLMQPAVRIDNDSSDFFTVIEVKASVSTDTLMRISETISRHGLSIHRAFIATDADLSVNIFYVVDETGEKINDRNIQTALINAIRKAAGEIK